MIAASDGVSRRAASARPERHLPVRAVISTMRRTRVRTRSVSSLLSAAGPAGCSWTSVIGADPNERTYRTCAVKRKPSRKPRV